MSGWDVTPPPEYRVDGPTPARLHAAANLLEQESLLLLTLTQADEKLLEQFGIDLAEWAALREALEKNELADELHAWAEQLEAKTARWVTDA